MDHPRTHADPRAGEAHWHALALEAVVYLGADDASGDVPGPIGRGKATQGVTVQSNAIPTYEETTALPAQYRNPCCPLKRGIDGRFADQISLCVPYDRPIRCTTNEPIAHFGTALEVSQRVTQDKLKSFL